MKQHITPEQLNELSEKGKEVLFQWWKPRFDIPEGFEYRLSIGQMIEFLDEKAGCNWEIRLHRPRYDVNYPDSKISPDFEDYGELCDALWYVVKEVLEK